jgi:hypothetical protein
VLADDLVRNRVSREGNRDQAASSALDGLANRFGHFIRLSGREADPPLTVADSHERVEREAPASLDDLCDAVDRDDVLDELTPLAITALAAAAAVSASASATAAGATASAAAPRTAATATTAAATWAASPTTATRTATAATAATRATATRTFGLLRGRRRLCGRAGRAAFRILL